MARLTDLIESNRRWAASVRSSDPEFFRRLSQQQTPRYMWIGCSDSRVPANQICGLAPGEVFVHRNIANVVVHADLNLLSVLQFAVDLLRVEHVIVCGHLGCSGVRTALEGTRVGLADNWLRHVGDVVHKHREALDGLSSADARAARLCELNVIEQVENVCQTTVVRDAWDRGQSLSVHGWLYGVHDGLIRDLDLAVSSGEEMTPAYERAIAAALAQTMPTQGR